MPAPIPPADTPAVSVVMPLGGLDDLVVAQFEALAAQTHPGPWELIVSFNSPDADARARTAEAAERLLADVAHVEVIDSSSVRSAAHARNAGAAAARSDVLAFCDGDDLAEPDWLQRLIEPLDRFGAVGGHLGEERLAVAGQENWRPPATPGDNPSFLGHPYLVSANMAVRAELFRKAGGFDESLIRGEDIAFSWALLDLGVELGFAPDAVVHYRHRRGLRPMLAQHYLYGRGMSQLLARRGLPGGRDAGSAMFKANGQSVERLNAVHVLRKGALATGRLVGLADEKRRQLVGEGEG